MEDALSRLVVEAGEQADIVKRFSNCFFLRQVIEHVRCRQLFAQLIEFGLIGSLDDEHVDCKCADLLVGVSLNTKQILRVLCLVEQVQVFAELPVNLHVG